ncbi:MAG: Mrp family chromosome partitioning ATPase [Glaciecola sp.]|jgi:Mrp family chromosome partitioning ATPase
MDNNTNQSQSDDIASNQHTAPKLRKIDKPQQATKSKFAVILQKIRRTYTRWQLKRNVKESEDLIAYRTMALQLIHDKTRSPSLLIVSADRDESAAHSCVLLTMALSSVIKRSVLIIDVSIAGSILPELLGCNSRAGEKIEIPPETRKQRFFEDDLGWFFNTREGLTVGPFLSLADAKLALEHHIENDLFETAPIKEQHASEFIMASKSNNIDYLSAVSAGLHSSLEHKSEELFIQEIAKLMEEVRQKYEYIVFYGGYLQECPTGMKVASQVGKVVLTTTENQTSQEEYRSAVKTLRLCGVESFNNMLIKLSSKALSSSGRNK